jgi:hypothetical protein
MTEIAEARYQARGFLSDCVTAPIQSSLCLCESNDAFTDCGAIAEGCHAAVLMDK